MTKTRHWSAEDIDLALAMHAQGRSLKMIAEHVRRTISAVDAKLKRLKYCQPPKTKGLTPRERDELRSTIQKLRACFVSDTAFATESGISRATFNRLMRTRQAHVFGSTYRTIQEMRRELIKGPM